MHLDYVTDDGAGQRARLGLIVLHVDETVESELRRLIDLDGVVLHCTRVRSGTEVTRASLHDMAARIPEAARLFPPATTLDVIGFACTSGAAIIGPENVARSIREARPGDGPGGFAATRITDPVTAVQAACRALGVQRLAFVSPYIESVSAALRRALQAGGLAISAFGSFEQAEEHAVARIAPQSIADAILRVGSSAPCDAVFVSCTNARTLEVLPDAERQLGLPVLTSNQVLAWHMLRQSGIADALPGRGALLLR